MSPKRLKMRRRAPRAERPTLEAAAPETAKTAGKPPAALMYGAAALLVAMGQWILLKSQSAWGYLLTILGALLGLSAYLGYLDALPWPSLPRKDKTPSPVPPPPPVPKTRPQPGKAAALIPAVAPASGLSRLTPEGVIRAMLLVFSLVLGAMGQYYLSDNGRLPIQGFKFYIPGVMLFLAVFWPWQKEGIKKLNLPLGVEMAVFGLILALAAFLRIYKLDTIPSGVFFDMGFQGLGALKVWREHWFPWELNITEGFPSAPIPIYVGSLWFLVFPNTQFCLNLFYVTFCLASFPLIYWTFRQLAGPRVALLTLYILAVMRWNINFARNSFPPALLPFFMFGCLALYLYGMRTGKTWAFVVSAVSAALGLYAYQTHIFFPVLVVTLMAYDFLANRKVFAMNIFRIGVFWLVFTVVSIAFFIPLMQGRSTDRARSLSILNRVKMEHSIRPLVVNTQYTALMFNRRGDPNPRHNLQDYRQLDDVTGLLFFFGVFYALSRFWRRKYFWGLSGAFIMALPCLLTIDPAHSSRMHGMTAFVAFLAASTLSAVWARVAAFAGALGEVLWVLLLSAPLCLMAWQNYNVYFNIMPKNMGCWGEYSIAESAVGRNGAKWGKLGDEVLISPRFWCHFTVDYFTYFIRNQVQRMTMPESLRPKRLRPEGGYFYTMEQGRTGMQKSLAWAYPGGLATEELNPSGTPFIHFYRVTPEAASQADGLSAEYSSQKGKELQAAKFPEGLPPGPYHARFEGVWYAAATGNYRFPAENSVAWKVAGRDMSGGALVELAKGFYKVVIDWDAPAGATAVPLKVFRDGQPYVPDATCFSRAPLNHGVLAEFYDNPQFHGRPSMVQWEPCINYINGNDFAFSHPSLAAKWKGTLKCPVTGDYRFTASGCGAVGKIVVDGVTAFHDGMGKMVTLEKGSHALEVEFPRPYNQPMAFTLNWTKPGDALPEVVSMQYFGTSEPLH